MCVLLSSTFPCAGLVYASLQLQNLRSKRTTEGCFVRMDPSPRKLGGGRRGGHPGNFSGHAGGKRKRRDGGGDERGRHSDKSGPNMGMPFLSGGGGGGGYQSGLSHRRKKQKDRKGPSSHLHGKGSGKGGGSTGTDTNSGQGDKEEADATNYVPAIPCPWGKYGCPHELQISELPSHLSVFLAEHLSLVQNFIRTLRTRAGITAAEEEDELAAGRSKKGIYTIRIVTQMQEVLPENSREEDAPGSVHAPYNPNSFLMQEQGSQQFNPADFSIPLGLQTPTLAAGPTQTPLNDLFSSHSAAGFDQYGSSRKPSKYSIPQPGMTPVHPSATPAHSFSSAHHFPPIPSHRPSLSSLPPPSPSSAAGHASSASSSVAALSSAASSSAPASANGEPGFFHRPLTPPRRKPNTVPSAAKDNPEKWENGYRDRAGEKADRDRTDWERDGPRERDRERDWERERDWDRDRDRERGGGRDRGSGGGYMVDGQRGGGGVRRSRDSGKQGGAADSRALEAMPEDMYGEFMKSP
eukprot:g46542.t1